jgi:hypothetical protein
VATACPGTGIVFSCRRQDYTAPLSTPSLRVPHVLVEPLSDDQIRTFVEAYAPGEAAAVWRQLSDSAPLDLLRSPYFLSLLVELVTSTGELPLGRVGLLTGFVRHALRREVERGHHLFQPDDLLTEQDCLRILQARRWRSPGELPEHGALVRQLGRLAYEMQHQGDVDDGGRVRVDYTRACDLLDHERCEDILHAGMALAVLEEDTEQDEVAFSHQLLRNTSRPVSCPSSRTPTSSAPSGAPARSRRAWKRRSRPWRLPTRCRRCPTRAGPSRP